MKLALAVDKYVSRRRSDGSPFVSSELNLKAFCRWCGDIELSSLAAESVTEFLNSPRCNAVTRVSKFSSIKCFVAFGVQIMSPHFQVQPGHNVVIPPSKWHEAPAEPDPDLPTNKK